MITIALVYKSMMMLQLLSRFAAGQQMPRLYRAWYRIDEMLSLYGWIAAVAVLLAWSYYWARHGGKPELEVRLACALLILTSLASGARFILSLVPAKWASVARGQIESHPDLMRTLPWGTVGLALVIISLNSETRDRLLGNGRALTLVGLGVLVLVILLTLLGWPAF